MPTEQTKSSGSMGKATSRQVGKHKASGKYVKQYAKTFAHKLHDWGVHLAKYPNDTKGAKDIEAAKVRRSLLSRIA